MKNTTPLLFLASLTTFSLFTFDLFQPALPAMTRYFNTTQALGQLTLSLYLLVFGLAQLIWGPLIDHYGRRRTLVRSLLLFLIATLFCIFASNIEMMLVARTIQGFAVCCCIVMAYAASRDHNDSTDRARVLSHISMIVTISPIFAPVLGSIVLIQFGWQATFVLMALFGFILLLLSFVMLHESPHWGGHDGTPFLLKTSLKQYGEIFRHRRLWLGIILATAAFSTSMIVLVNASYLIINTLHFSPLFFSILFACNGLIIIIGNFLGIELRKHYSLFNNIRIGCTLMVAGAVTMLTISHYQGFTLLSLAPALLSNLGSSLTTSPTLAWVLSDYQHNAATATAIINTSRISMGAIIAGIVGTLLVNHLASLAIGILCCGISGLTASLFFRKTDAP